MNKYYYAFYQMIFVIIFIVLNTHGSFYLFSSLFGNERIEKKYIYIYMPVLTMVKGNDNGYVNYHNDDYDHEMIEIKLTTKQ